MGSCYDIMEDEVSVSPTQPTLPENEMADLDVEMCEKKLNKWLHKYCDFIESLVKGKVRCTYICVCIHICAFS